MFKRTVSPDDLIRLKQERETADQAYNAALTALDGAVQRLRDLPDPPHPYDGDPVASLSDSGDLLAEPSPAATGWRARVRALVVRVAAPVLSRQQSFNATLVDHVRHSVTAHRELARAVDGILAVLRDDLGRLVTFQTRLVEYAQQITPYVDTKDYEVTGLMRRINEDVADTTNELERRVAGLAGGLSGVGDELQKRWESMVARERRFQTQLAEMRATSASWHQVTQTLKRELERLQAAPVTAVPAPIPTDAASPPPAESHRLSAGVDSGKYVGFEDEFRGAADEIARRVATYVPYFEGCSNVLDAGCGRGEFLALLQEQGISASGVDINPEMVELCRARGLAVEATDVLSHLNGLDDQSVGGLFAAQVVEHLEPGYLLRLLDTAFLKLRPGAAMVLETINVASWSAFFQSYVRDITHVRPLHPDTLRYLVTASGFQQVDVLYRSPYPPENRLELAPLPSDPPADTDTSTAPELAASVRVMNRNMDRLNRLLFADQDYAVVGRRP